MIGTEHEHVAHRVTVYPDGRTTRQQGLDDRLT
jgi:hypothetical protein